MNDLITVNVGLQAIWY